MDYQVWIEDEYENKYTKVECGDLGAAKREIDQAYKRGQAPILTVEVPYSLAIKVEDVGTEKPSAKKRLQEAADKLKESRRHEANQSEPEQGKDTRTESKGQV